MILIGGLVGFVIGFLGFTGNIQELPKLLNGAIGFFCANIAPSALILLAVILPAVCLPSIKKSRKLFKTGCDNDDEEALCKAEKIVNRQVVITSTIFILSFFFLTAVYSKGIDYFFESDLNLMFIISIVAFTAIMFETMVFQQKTVDSAKIANPEKNVSLYDLKFRKKWIDCCDEAEKAAIGKCAYKAYSTTNKACAIIAGVLAVIALLFGTSILPAVVVYVIWLINQFSYYREAAKLSKGGSSTSL